MQRSLPLLIALLWASPAWAAPTAPFVVMGEPCAIDTVELDRWSAFGTNPLTVSTDTLPDTAGALCSAKATLVSGQTTYGAMDLASAQSTYNLTCRMKVTTLPGVETRLADFYSTASSQSGAILTLVPTDSAHFALHTAYRDETLTVCNGSTTNDTVCTPTADPSCSDIGRDLALCPEISNCEARCETRVFASAVHAVGSWITWTMQQENGSNAEVAVRLWSGDGSRTPAAYSRGGGFHTVGYCAGGASANLACLTNADCPSSTCTTTRKVTINRIRLGKTDTGTGTGLVYYAKCFGYAGSTAYPNLMWDTAQPNANPTPGNWVSFEGSGDVRTCSDTNLWDCLTDGNAPDGRLSAIENANIAKPTAYFNYGAIATPSPMPTPLAVAMEVEAQQAAAGTSTLDLEATTTGASATSDFSSYLLSYADSGTSAGFYSPPTFVTTNSTVLSNAQNGTLQMQIARAGSGSNKMRITVAPVSVIRQTADPVLVSSLVDRNGDGDISVQVAGDSVSDNATYQQTLTDRVAGVDITNLTFCTAGNRALRDMRTAISGILAGTTTQDPSCRSVTRGTGGNVADVVTIMAGVNDFHHSQMGPPSNLTTVEGGIAQDGFCETATGAGTNQAGACRCENIPIQGFTTASGSHGYCLTKGSGVGAFGATCHASSDCTCSSNADCTLNGVTGVCSGGACATAPIFASTACRISNTSASKPSITSWCASACNDAAACSGLCVQSPTVKMLTDEFEAIDTTLAAYPTPAATPPAGGPPIVVYVAEPPPQYATGNLDTGGNVFPWGPGVGCWRSITPHLEAVNGWLRQWTAANHRRRFMDADAWFKRKCPVRNKVCSDTSCCNTDPIHPNAHGQEQLAELFYHCFANTPDGVTFGVTHDGTCTTGTCTTGKIGDACASDDDCDYYRCNWTL